MHKALISIATSGKWDIVFINKAELVSPAVIAQIKKKAPEALILYWYGDQRGKALPEIAAMGREADALLINNSDKNQFFQYYDMGVEKIFTHHTATDLDTFKYLHGTEEFDAVFIGSNYNDRFPDSMTRLRLMKRATEKNNMILYGNNWPNHFQRGGQVYGKDFSVAVARSKMTLGINAYNNICGYTSNRTWNSLACGRPHLVYYYLGIEEMFDNYKHLIWFKNISEALKIIKELKKDEVLRNEIGRNGRDLIAEKHTYYHRALEIKDLYETWRDGQW